MHSSVLLVSADWNHRCVAEAAVDGHAIRTVPSYREALNVLGRWGVRLLFCDDALHDGNWRDILSHVAITPEPPRVVVLASSERIIEQARHLGAWEAIRKPVSEAAIRQVIGRAELRGDAARRQKK